MAESLGKGEAERRRRRLAAMLERINDIRWLLAREEARIKDEMKEVADA